MSEPVLYGILAEFETPEQLLRATQAASDAGYKRMDAYTPMPVHGLAEMLHVDRAPVTRLVLGCGILGCLGGYGLQYYMAVLAYAHNVGGRPVHSWPSFIPVTFETTVLCAALSAVFGMLAMNALPQPYHPVFNVPAFARASQDRFFLCIQADDPQFDTAAIHTLLQQHHTLGVSDVPS